MNPFLLIAAILTFLIGAAHTALGEKFIVSRLVAEDVTWGKHEVFKRRTVRFAWHLTTILCWGLGFILLNMSLGLNALFTARGIIATTFAVCALLALIGSRGRHLSWIVFA